MKTFTVNLTVTIDSDDDIKADDIRDYVEVSDDIFDDYSVQQASWKVKSVKEMEEQQ